MMTLQEIEEFTSKQAVNGFVVDYWNVKDEIHTPESLMAIFFVAGYLAANNDRLTEKETTQ